MKRGQTRQNLVGGILGSRYIHYVYKASNRSVKDMVLVSGMRLRRIYDSTIENELVCTPQSIDF